MKNDTGQAKPFKISNTMYHVFWGVLLVSAAACTVVQLDRYQSYNKDRRTLVLQLEQQAAANESLRKELEYYGTDAYVERVAGEKLGLVKPDEIVFYNSEE